MTSKTSATQALLTRPFLSRNWYRYRRSLLIFVAICANLAIAPALYANNQPLSNMQAYAIGLLLLTTLALSIYLFAVIFVPEKF